MRQYFARVTAWRPGGYMRASGGLLGWMMLRAAGQAVLVITLARLLGVQGYGRFVAALAVASFFVPLAGLGLQGVLLRDLARAPDRLPELLGQALRLWWRSTTVFGILGIGVAFAVLPRQIPELALFVFVPAEVVSGSLVDLLARIEQSQHRVGRFGAMTAGLVLARLLAVAIYSAWHGTSVEGWMWAYAIGSAGYTAMLLAWAWRTYQPYAPRRVEYALVREGLPFAWGALTLRLQAEFNKPVLAQLGYALAGSFSAAQRAVDVACLPLAAMQEALWPRLYASVNPVGRMLFTTTVLLCLALSGGVILYFAAPLLPRVLGKGFGNTAELLRWLAWLPALQVVRNVAGFHVVAIGRTSALAWAYAAGAVTSIVATTILTMRHGLAGAAVALYLSECAMIVMQLVLSGRQGSQQAA
ncbi:MAG: oligosaccharide flippase family protein [Acidiferrobacterales bacterium]